MAATDQHALDTVRGWIAGARSIVALTGAGISTESGIPDFRGPSGVWTRDAKAERLSHIDAYVSDPALRVEVWRQRIAHPAWSAVANPGHRALVDLEHSGRLSMLVTQNIDGLHRDAGTSPGLLIEIHGTMRDVICLACGDRFPAQQAFDRVRAGEEDPPCLGCGGILKSATISFGQSLIPEDLARAERAAAECDLLLAIGTSLLVYPVAGLPRIALEHGARLVIVNGEPTPYDGAAHAVVRLPIGQVLPRLIPHEPGRLPS
ncbi:MAG TPA: Sir2 family NAD-dependent protein deacetylase [Actinomycetota bacterium]|nr:Sir2 family NAD-dependent protein deacetylase [Actinomycetota bacterium]